MNRVFEVAPKYVDTIPRELEESILYISLKYGVSVHLCACGCSGKTALPLEKGQWTLTDNNGMVSLTPSIGNWAGERPYHAPIISPTTKLYGTKPIRSSVIMDITLVTTT